MTTSGTSSWNATITQMIASMYRKVGAISEDEAPTAGMYNDAIFSGNALIKEWMAKGIHVWTEEEAILFLQQGQYRYLLGGDTNDNCTDANGWFLMELTQPLSPGDSTVHVNFTVGTQVNDYLGIVDDDGTMLWTTVSAVPTASTFTVPTVGITASAQNNAVSYRTKIVRPLQVPRCRQIYYQGGQSGPRETPMSVLSRKEYMDLPQKANEGVTTQFFYSPQLVQGEYYAWPTPQNANFGARLTWYRPLMDLSAPAQTADVPQEWLNALMWNLAKEMGPEFDMPPARWQMIQQMAEEKLDLVQSYDRESEPILFGMGYDETAR